MGRLPFAEVRGIAHGELADLELAHVQKRTTMAGEKTLLNLRLCRKQSCLVEFGIWLLVLSCCFYRLILHWENMSDSNIERPKCMHKNINL